MNFQAAGRLESMELDSENAMQTTEDRGCFRTNALNARHTCVKVACMTRCGIEADISKVCLYITPFAFS